MQLHLKLICLKPPQPLFEGETTLFGLQDRKLQLHPGQMQGDGSLLFEFDVSVALSAENKTIRFRGVVATCLILTMSDEASSYHSTFSSSAGVSMLLFFVAGGAFAWMRLRQ